MIPVVNWYNVIQHLAKCVCIDSLFCRDNFQWTIAGCDLASVFQSLPPIMLSTITIVLLAGHQSKEPSLAWIMVC